jgi:hypothetical protein
MIPVSASHAETARARAAAENIQIIFFIFISFGDF